MNLSALVENKLKAQDEFQLDFQGLLNTSLSIDSDLTEMIVMHSLNFEEIHHERKGRPEITVDLCKCDVVTYIIDEK